MATVTISLSSLLLAAALLAVAYALYRLYDLFCVQPVKFQQYWKAQGINGATQRDAQQRTGRRSRCRPSARADAAPVG
jgi:cytochrome c oxidase assembly protein Cox11